MEKCSKNHKKELLDFLQDSASENCFLYGDIENFSLDSDFMDVWYIKNDNLITSILLRYYNYYVVHSTDKKDYPEILDTVKLNKNALGISGLESVIDDLNRLKPLSDIKRLYLAELNKTSFTGFSPKEEPKRATKDDLEKLFDFESSIEEFSLDESSRESFGQEVITNTGRIYFIENDKGVVSTAGLTAENSLNGMIIGVATAPDFRKKGFAKECVGRLCLEMIKEDKSVLLFYNNPDAGKLYKSLGFKDINRWVIAKF
ncbi:GNAT family N-acetyltransferase [Thiospirochaeta perfilievii]|uniref:GNAT family N-acetyltransferase n=1 Tax=Thiospirochaeta perfilievii TaxID=252967 RepID=A0A5C1QEN3_9SPIO|nr:GNAT family N-acetyltransferase [Thiospirochaeta perfilievii]QEN05106.1 GNAT family N-acetyltransferase [Thiospirochaeta perfilievii]